MSFVELISQGESLGPGFYIGHDPSGFIRVSDSWLFTGVPFGSIGVMHHYALTVDGAAGIEALRRRNIGRGARRRHRDHHRRLEHPIRPAV